MIVKTYDQRCFDLAEHFIGDGPKGSISNKKCSELAAHIQQTIEDWIESDIEAHQREIDRTA